MKNRSSEQTLVTLANAAELVADLAQENLGNDMANTFAGSRLTRTIVLNLVQAEFQTGLTKRIGAQ